VGDYGMGFVANSLELGCDCLGHIKYFDGVVNNASGEPVVIRKAICMHEEDAGLLWKHTDTRLNHVEVRRNRRLVLSMLSTFANYEYGMYWHFYLVRQGREGVGWEQGTGGVEWRVCRKGVAQDGVLVAPAPSALPPLW
jgi:Cu2+-containing amine oxidase